MARRDYQAIAAEYIEGWDSLRSLAQKHAIPFSTLRDRARRELWEARRQERRDALRGSVRAETETDGGEAERILRVADKLVRRAEAILDEDECALGTKELGELMRAVKNAKEIRMLRPALDEREQEARVRALEEKLTAAAPGPLEIAFSPEAEEAAG